MIIDRDRYIDQLSRSKGNGLIKIITGLRRSGKSFLLKKLFRQHLLDEGIKENHILIIDMESRKNKEFKNPDHLLDWVEKMMEDDETYYIIIDEVQEVDDFVEVLSSLSVTDGTDIYVTGSNSRFLSSDVVTEFRGRGDEIHVWPLSFREFMSVYKGTQEEGWAEYRLYGGLPQLLTQIGDDKKADFLRRLYRTVYLRDIYERNRIELQAEFEDSCLKHRRTGQRTEYCQHIQIGKQCSKYNKQDCFCLSGIYAGRFPCRKVREIRHQRQEIHRFTGQILLSRCRSEKCHSVVPSKRTDAYHGECNLQ